MKRTAGAFFGLLCLVCAGFWQAARGGTDLPQYNLSVHLLPDAHRLEAAGTLRLPATDRAASELQLFLSDSMRDLRIEIIEPKESAGPARAEKREPGRWVFLPPRPIPAGERALLRFSYAGGERTGVVFYIGPEGSFAGGLNTVWYPQPNKEKGVGSIEFSVPAGYSVMATGAQRQTPREAARGIYRFDVDRPTYFGFAAARYTVLRQENSAVPVSAYLLRPREEAEQYMNGCSQVLELLAQEFGDYPYGEFALVEVPQEQANNAGFSGASIDGFILADSPSFDEPFNLAYYGHEIGHQWWGNVIRTKDIRGSYMLGEGIAQYGALRTVEQLEGTMAAEKFRRTGYPGYNLDQSGLGYLRHAAAGFDHRLADLPDDSVSHQIANSKGFLVLDLLSRTVGRTRFSQILRDFTRRNAFRPVTWDEFLEAVEEGAGTSLKWFFAQWFEQTGAPEWKLTWNQEGKTLRGVIAQTPPFYRATVEVQADGRDGQRTLFTVEVNGAATEFARKMNFTVRSITLDPHFLVLHWPPEYRAEALALAAYTRANRKRMEGKFGEAQEEFRAALGRITAPDLYGAEFMLRYGLARALISQQKWGEARVQLEAAVASPTRQAEVLPRAYLQLARAAKELKDEPALRRAADAAISADAAVGGRTGVAREAGLLVKK